MKPINCHKFVTLLGRRRRGRWEAVADCRMCRFCRC